LSGNFLQLNAGLTEVTTDHSGWVIVISRAIDMQFVCTLPATSRCTHLSLNPVLRRMCMPTPPTSLTTTRELPQVPASTVTSDCIITAEGK